MTFEAVEEISCGLDHVSLVGSFRGSQEEQLYTLLRSHGLGCDGEDSVVPFHGKFYDDGMADVDMRWALSKRSASDANAFYLQIHGKGCADLGLDGVISLTRSIMEFLGVKCSRLDPQMDLPGRLGSSLIALAQQGILDRSCYRGRKRVTRENRIRPTLDGEVTGDTIYLGSPSSSVYGRWYDKGLESKRGELGDLVRLEIQHRKDRANGLLLKLLDSDFDDVPRLISEHVLGAFEFKKEGVHLPWFAQLIQLAGVSSVARVSGDPVFRSYDKWRNWMGGPTSQIKRFQSIADEYNSRMGTSVTKGWVMDNLFLKLSSGVRSVNDDVTMAATKVLMESRCLVDSVGQITD